MGLWEVSFRTQYDYPFIQMSARHPGVPISMWCIWGRELLQVPTQDEHELAAIEKEIRKAGRVIDRWIEAQEARIFMLVERGTVVAGERPVVLRKVPGHPVEDDAETGLVAGIDKETQVVRRTVARGRREIAGGLVAPGFVERVLGDRQQFEVGVALFDRIGHQAPGQFPDLAHELQVLELRSKIANEARSEMTKEQRDYMLRQQMRAIQQELGEVTTLHGVMLDVLEIGVLITGSGTKQNDVQGNYIGTDVTGTIALGNSGPGVFIAGSSNNVIGTNAAGDRNVISGNASGVVILAPAALSVPTP